MKTTTRFLSAAVFAAIAFTFFACSSDDSDDNPGGGGGGGGIVNPSDLSNKQVYIVERGSTEEDKDTYRKTGEYSDNIDVIMRIYSRTGNHSSVPAGKIQNGKLSLDLPSISSEHFYKFSGNCEDFDPETSYDYSSCEGSISAPENLQFFDDFSLEVDIPGKECYIRLFSVRSGEWLRGSGLYYVSEAGAVTGTETYTYRGDEEVRSHTWNANFSQGWNVLFYDYDTRTSTTALPAGTALEWGLYCYGDLGPSGPDGSLNGTWQKPPFTFVIEGSSVIVIENNETQVIGSITYDGSSGSMDFGPPIGGFDFNYYKTGPDLLNISVVTEGFELINGEWNNGPYVPPEVDPSSIPIKTLRAILPGKSYFDLDGVAGRVYPSSQVAANASKIDIVYTEDNEIWAAFEYGWMYSYELLEDNDAFIAPLSAVAGPAIVAQIQTVLTTESTISEATLASWQQSVEADELVDAVFDSEGYIDLVQDKVFVVYTTEGDIIVAAANPANASISYLLLY